MKFRYLTYASPLCFRKWSRKSYAVFASLGRNVVIGVLALNILAVALLKTAAKGLILVREFPEIFPVALCIVFGIWRTNSILSEEGKGCDSNTRNKIIYSGFRTARFLLS